MLRLTFFLLLFVSWSWCCEAAAPTPEVRLAFVVGNNVGHSNETPLRYAEDEAGKVARTLMQLGQVPVHHLTLLRGKSSLQFWKRLRITTRQAQRLRKHARVILFFYYSGHGSQGALHLGSQKASIPRIKKLLNQSGAQTVIAFFDACHSGAVVRRKGFKRRPNFKIHLESGGAVRGRVYIASSGEYEASLESDDVQGSYFTHFLISGLRGQADRNKDGRVDVDELYQYTYRRTVARTAMTRRGIQHPSFELGLRGTGRLILSWPQRSKSGLVFGASLTGTYLILSSHEQVLMAEVRKKKGERTFVALPPQSYLVRKRADRGYYVAEVNLLWGGRKTFDPKGMVYKRYRSTVRKGKEFVGPPNKLSAMFDVRSGVVAGNAFLLGVRATYKHRFSSNFSLGFDASYHRGTLVSSEFTVTTQAVNLDASFLFHQSWGRVSLNVGGLVGGGLVWQELPQQDLRSSPAFRAGAISSLRWLFAQPWALHLMIQGGAEFSNVGGQVQVRPYILASLGPAFWW